MRAPPFINDIHTYNLARYVPCVFVIKMVYFVRIWPILSVLHVYGSVAQPPPSLKYLSPGNVLIPSGPGCSFVEFLADVVIIKLNMSQNITPDDYGV